MRRKRADAVQGRLNRFPYKYDAIDNAYAAFLSDGTLPEDNALAWRVLKRVLHARKPLPPHPDDLVHATGRPLYQPHGNTREMLFREACCAFGPARELSRSLLKTVVIAGHDPTDSELIKPELEAIDFGTVGLQLLGWPQDFVRPEYRQQLERVLQQQAADRVTRPRREEWTHGAAAALCSFMSRGVLPADPRYIVFVLTTGEIFALCGNYFRGGGEDVIAAYDAVATSTDGDRAAALCHLAELQARNREERDARP